MKQLRLLLCMALTGAAAGIVLTASPASACVGDPCDGFCATYAELPPTVQNKVFRSTHCPIE